MKTRKFYEEDLLNTKPRTAFGARILGPGSVGREHFGHDTAPRFGGFADLARDQRGVAVIEYALLCGLIAIGAVTAILGVGDDVSTRWNNVDSELGAAMDSGNGGNGNGHGNGNGNGNGRGNGRGHGNGNGNGRGNGHP